MSGLLNKIKEKTTSSHSSSDSKHQHHDQSNVNQGTQTDRSNSNEPTYSIQPHPAKSEDPRDLEPPQLGGGLNSNPEYGAFHARDPHVPNQAVLNEVKQPAASRDELRARQEELNR
ncbi:hypothetical protein EIP91_008049 [Steccherinum ochraceum]|uniref:Uncharacterized protein n=1 Tax=Steccherinum ochraceum TaxID=92696 RepID=A0A4R0S0G0_9APHY|nr:hypothetical protein EIP91_008049 [Steccherinum ochraceum]